MLTTPITVLSIRYPPVVNVNSSSHSFKHKMSISGGYLMLKTVKGAVNINYWWVPYAYNCERGC
jgi:hypothetical protein